MSAPESDDEASVDVKICSAGHIHVSPSSLEMVLTPKDAVALAGALVMAAVDATAVLATTAGQKGTGSCH